jgi:hypothetical protein
MKSLFNALIAAPLISFGLLGCGSGSSPTAPTEVDEKAKAESTAPSVPDEAKPEDSSLEAKPASGGAASID